jgi:hypothetical protein
MTAISAPRTPPKTTVDAPTAVVIRRARRSTSNWGYPARGYAVLIDGEWKVARDTFCDLAATLGVNCPPRDP